MAAIQLGSLGPSVEEEQSERRKSTLSTLFLIGVVGKTPEDFLPSILLQREKKGTWKEGRRSPDRTQPCYPLLLFFRSGRFANSESNPQKNEATCPVSCHLAPVRCCLRKRARRKEEQEKRGIRRGGVKGEGGLISPTFYRSCSIPPANL